MVDVSDGAIVAVGAVVFAVVGIIVCGDVLNGQVLQRAGAADADAALTVTIKCAAINGNVAHCRGGGSTDDLDAA